MYYILIETQDNEGIQSVTPHTFKDIADATEAYYSKAMYTPKTTADYMGVMLIRNDGLTILPMVKGPIKEEQTEQ